MALLTLVYTVAAVLCTSFAYFVHALYNHRSKFNELRKRGVPMPKEWNWITGHLMVLGKYVEKIPPDAAVAFAMRELCQEYADTEIFLMDFWPMYPALFTIFSPQQITQICNRYNLPKTVQAAKFMNPVTGGPSLITMNGDEWKYWRSLFNPGFSTGAMLNSVPHIVDSVLVFREKLIEQINNGIFPLDDLTTKLTTEIILKVTLDDDSNHQRTPHIVPTALNVILDWHSFWDPRVLLHPLRPLFQWYYGTVVDKYLRKELEKRFQETKEARSDVSKAKPKEIKSVISLALEAYLDGGHDKMNTAKDVLDERFAKFASSQIRLFLFAGTDTSSSTLVYIYHMLAKHPDWLSKLREEHAEVFGRDPAKAAGLLKTDPSLLNQCKLTLAFIKEVLRFYAPAGTMRTGLPGMNVTDLQGNEQPLEAAGANILHQALHYNPRAWVRPKEFLPERFLVPSDHELYPDPTAFRPFEQGPRNCIGQTLVYNELKVAIILTCRDLDIRDAYDDFDALREKQRGAWEKLKIRVMGEPIRTLFGDRAYQTDSGGLHPVDRYPCYVKWAEGASAAE